MTTIEHIEKALDTVSALCSGRMRWHMSIPANEEGDPDIILSRALRLARDELTKKCEWTKKYPTFTSGCGVEGNFMYYDYCPYCGKEIHVK